MFLQTRYPAFRLQGAANIFLTLLQAVSSHWQVHSAHCLQSQMSKLYNWLFLDENFQRAVSPYLKHTCARYDLSALKTWTCFTQDKELNLPIDALERFTFLKGHHLGEHGSTLIEVHQLERYSRGAYKEDFNNLKAEHQKVVPLMNGKLLGRRK